MKFVVNQKGFFCSESYKIRCGGIPANGGISRQGGKRSFSNARLIQPEVPYFKELFSANEWKVFLEFPDDRKLYEFYKVWTRKEAYFKALGTGLSKPLNEIEIAFKDPVDYQLISLDFSQNFAGFVATPLKNPHHYIHRF